MESQLIGAKAPARVSTGQAAASVYGSGDRLAGFVALVRPIFFVLTPVNAASAAVLALGGFPALAPAVLGFIAVALASCASNVGNDYLDRERDKVIWPDRPLPGGRVKPGEALAVAGTSLVISLGIAWFFFYPATFVILALAMVLSLTYSAWLRDRVGYLALPPIVGLIYLGGWAAFSPATLFGSWLPWYLYLLGVVWQTAHIMIYYPLHLSPQAGHKAPPALFFVPTAAGAVKIGVVFTGLTLALAAGLFFIVPLGALYLGLVIVAGAYALWGGIRLLKKTDDRRRGLKAFTALSLYRLVISAAVLLAVFLWQI